MVKKLFKHEIKSYTRILFPVWGILLAVAVMGRLIQFFEQDTIVYEIVQGSSVLFYVLAAIVALFFPAILGVIRFYKNLFTGEGYLSFTLPVTPFQHIYVKVITAVMLEVLALVAVVLSSAVIMAGDVLAEVSKAAGYLISVVYKELGYHTILYALEVVVAVLTGMFYGYLFYYSCIAVGQLFKKNRVLAAAGAYFAWYLLTQLVGTVLTIVAAFLDWEPLFVAVSEHPIATGHIVLCGSILLSAVFAVVFFVITHTIIRRRLNLE